MDPSLRYLPFHAERAQVETDPDLHAANYALVAPLLGFAARPGAPFRAEYVAARSGDVTLLAGTTTALVSEMNGSHDRSTLHVPFAGEAHFQLERQRLSGFGGQTAVLLPGMPRLTETPCWAGLSIGLDPRRLAAAAARLAGREEDAERFLPMFQQPLQLERRDRLVHHLLGYIDRVVGLIDLEPSRSQELPATLPVGQLIEQAVAVLVVRDLAVT